MNNRNRIVQQQPERCRLHCHCSRYSCSGSKDTTTNKIKGALYCSDWILTRLDYLVFRFFVFLSSFAPFVSDSFLLRSSSKQRTVPVSSEVDMPQKRSDERVLWCHLNIFFIWNSQQYQFLLESSSSRWGPILVDWVPRCYHSYYHPLPPRHRNHPLQHRRC